MRGVNLHARQVVDGRDRRRLERVWFYVTRPPIAEWRLNLRADGTRYLGLKNVWKDGTRAIVFSPEDLVLRLIAALRHGRPPIGSNSASRTPVRTNYREEIAGLGFHGFRADVETCVRCGGAHALG